MSGRSYAGNFPTGDGGGNGTGTSHNDFTPSQLNSFFMSEAINGINVLLGYGENADAGHLYDLYISLARCIDFATINHEVPEISSELPYVVKQVCRGKKDPYLVAAIMVLMISIKDACQKGWFKDDESKLLNDLAKRTAAIFCEESNVMTDPSCYMSTMDTVMSRFFPAMKMAHVFASLQVKPGFHAYGIDFEMSMNMKFSPTEKVRLFVIKTDTIETSSCLVTPARVNFLLNGMEVDRRTTLFMDSGPQVPTHVILRYGPNFLQAIGEFDGVTEGNYIIIVAVTREASSPDSNYLQDYEQHYPPSVDSDSDVIVGQSRISLKCPISFKRIKTPVKGRSCNHVQCFEFDNYVDMNSRRPSWRCPHCNQHVCFTDIRIDRKMMEILREAETNVSCVDISPDGSWKPVMRDEDPSDTPEDMTSDNEHGSSEAIHDLTQTDDAMECRYAANDYNALPSTFGRMMRIPSTTNPYQASMVPSFSLYQQGRLQPQNSTPPMQNGVRYYQQMSNPMMPSFPLYEQVRVQQQNAPYPPLNSRPPMQNVVPYYQRMSNPMMPSFPTYEQPRVQQQNAPYPPIISPPPRVQNAGAHDQQMPNPVASEAIPRNAVMTQPSRPRSSGVLSSTATQIRPVSNKNAHLVLAANRTAQMAIRGHYFPSMTNSSVDIGPNAQPFASADVEGPAESNWRPVGRMRGALSGQAYNEAYNQFISRPIQQAQAAESIPDTIPQPTISAPAFQTLGTDGALQGAPSNYPHPGSGGSNMGSAGDSGWTRRS